MKLLILLIALVVLAVQSQAERNCLTGFEVDVKSIPDHAPNTYCGQNEIRACAYDEERCWKQFGICGQKPCKYE